MNNAFLRALGVVALCYIVLRAATWIFASIFRITQGFGYWLQYTVIPHTWQIAIALGVIYLLYTAATGRRRRY